METKIVIDHHQLIKNLSNIKEVLKPGNVKILAVVKANAYGHGLLEVAHTLENRVDGFGVSYLREAIELTKGHIHQDILVMGPCYEFDQVLYPNIILSLESLEQWAKMEEHFLMSHEMVKPSNLRVHLKLNTGMNRFGFSKEELVEFLRLYQGSSCKEFVSIEGAYSHLAHTILTDKNAVYRQRDAFLEMKTVIEMAVATKLIFHLANGENAIDDPKLCFDQIRVGNVLYGPVLTKRKIKNSSVAKVLLPLVSVKHVRKGERLGYGAKNKARMDMRVGIVEGGSYEGIGLIKDTTGQRKSLRCKLWIKQGLRILIKKECLLYKNEALPILGMVNMQYTMIDLKTCDIKIGEYLEYKKAPLYIKEGVQRIHVTEDTNATT